MPYDHLPRRALLSSRQPLSASNYLSQLIKLPESSFPKVALSLFEHQPDHDLFEAIEDEQITNDFALLMAAVVAPGFYW